MANKEQQKNRGFYDFQQPLSKTQPGTPSSNSKGDFSGRKNTEHRDMNNGAHTFNYKGKVTNEGGNYMDFANKNAGLMFNGKQKDASLEYLRQRGKEGQEIRHFTGGSLNSKMKTDNAGGTVYPTNPINEVFRPGSSGKAPSPDIVVRPKKIVEESFPEKDMTKLGKQIRNHGK